MEDDSRETSYNVFGMNVDSSLSCIVDFIIYIEREPPVGFFQVFFIEGKKSKYRTQFSFKSNLTQEDIVCFHSSIVWGSTAYTHVQCKFNICAPWKKSPVCNPLQASYTITMSELVPSGHAHVLITLHLITIFLSCFQLGCSSFGIGCLVHFSPSQRRWSMVLCTLSRRGIPSGHRSTI